MNLTRENIALAASVLQGISATVLMTLALWAAFFTGLPEALFTQLRSELSEAKSEVEGLRRTQFTLEEAIANYEAVEGSLLARIDNLRLQTENTIADLEASRAEEIRLAATMSELEIEIASLNSVIAALNEERASLNESISRLRNESIELGELVATLSDEKDAYSVSVQRQTTQEVLALACYELKRNGYFANISANYGEHTRWLSANRQIERDRTQFDELSIQEQYSDGNSFARSFRVTQDTARTIPRFWIGLPTRPSFDPSANADQIGASMVVVLNMIGSDTDFREKHSYLINLLFDGIVEERGVNPETFQSLVERLLDEEEFSELSDFDRIAVSNTLRDMIGGSNDVAALRINHTFQEEPMAEDLAFNAVQILENIERAIDKLNSNASSLLGPDYDECSISLMN